MSDRVNFWNKIKESIESEEKLEYEWAEIPAHPGTILVKEVSRIETNVDVLSKIQKIISNWFKIPICLFYDVTINFTSETDLMLNDVFATEDGTEFVVIGIEGVSSFDARALKLLTYKPLFNGEVKLMYSMGCDPCNA